MRHIRNLKRKKKNVYLIHMRRNERNRKFLNYIGEDNQASLTFGKTSKIAKAFVIFIKK